MAKHNTVFDQMDVVTYEEVVKLSCNYLPFIRAIRDRYTNQTCFPHFHCKRGLKTNSRNSCSEHFSFKIPR